MQQRGCDPKGSELCLAWPKAAETPLEGLSGSDVQIDRASWA